ncbi:hypothetical protein QUB36_05725 [Microcoleus sp. AT8-B1]|uniref:hypothetical protein n=1 Tax=unclassified Microcoleus TaxID=2642155 RepID=UPI002FD437AA
MFNNYSHIVGIKAVLEGGGFRPDFLVSEGRRKKEEGRRKKEEGRRKKEEGRRKKGEGKLTGSLALAGNRDPEALPRLQKNRRQSNSEMRSQALPGNEENEEKTTFYKISLLPKLIIHQRQKRP